MGKKKTDSKKAGSGMERVLEWARREFLPREGERERLLDVFRRVKELVEKEYGVECDLMGSVAKGTMLRGAVDLDVFVLFPPETTREELEKKGLEIGRMVAERLGGRMEVAYAEHPYTRIFLDGYRIEVVPAYKLEKPGKIISAVDRTPFHKRFVLERLKNPEDVVILKAFLKGIRAYGSDLKTRGFSGYLCELLVIEYGSFERVLKSALSWKQGTVIDPGKHYPPGDYPLLRKKFGGQPLIVVDPVDPDRNVAAVLSVRQMANFVLHARLFLRNPSKSFFVPSRVDKKRALKIMRERGFVVRAILFERQDVVDDVWYPQLERLASRLRSVLEREGFRVYHHWVFGDRETGVCFELESSKLPKKKRVRGPSVFHPVEHQDRFIETHERVWLEDEFLVAEVEREHDTLESLVGWMFSGSEKDMKERGVPQAIAETVARRGYRILGDGLFGVSRIESEEFWRGAEREVLKWKKEKEKE